MSTSVPSGARLGEYATGYGAIAVAQAGLAIPLLFQPHATADFLLGAAALPHTVEHERLLGILAGSLLAGGAAAWALRGNAEAGDLDSSLSETLQLGLIGMGASALAVHFAHRADLTPGALAAGGVVSALTMAVPAARLLGSEKGRATLVDRVSSYFGALTRSLQFRRGVRFSSVVYGLLAPTLLVSGAAAAFAPAPTLEAFLGYVVKSRDSVFLWRFSGAVVATAGPAIALGLKEASDVGTLRNRANCTLNVGAFAASIAHVAALAPLAVDKTGGTYLPVLLGAWAATLVASSLGIVSTATKCGGA